MTKASFIIYITLAVALLLLISRSSNNNSHRHRHRHRRLKVRSNFNFTPPTDPRFSASAAAAFDPVVAEIERKREDKQWEHHYIQAHHPESTPPDHEWDDLASAEDYLNDEEKFNVTNRLLLLFPNIDIDPPDGYVSAAELTQWNLKQSQKEVLHRTQREMEVHDKNRDGFVTLAEYQPPSWVVNSDNNSFGYEMGWWKEEHFNASDVDGDGQLNITEFNDFLHPSDSTNHKLLEWLCKEEIRERDTDKDGKVNYKEFYHGIYDLIRPHGEGVQDSSHEYAEEAPTKTLFNQLDKDGDGYLSHIELLPVIQKIHPSELYYAQQQSEYIMQQADTDKDGRLSLTEMVENPYVFYSAVYDEDEDEDYDYHDEFR
ncbi:reticulocalbin-2-like [Salvia hispanica]|uniref:reticulocalbin-2-like n=1 Tax=Salvia hispanica TaxID=49212 RepID=UPI0020094F3E|nr:reticulocalbin-2-like [Salvia hispanica]